MCERGNIRKEKGNKGKEMKNKRGQQGVHIFKNMLIMYKIVLRKALLCINMHT